MDHPSRAVEGSAGKLIEGAFRELAAAAPKDCGDCRRFLVGKDGEPARVRFYENERVTKEDCARCEYILTDPMTFRWTPEARALWEDYRVLMRWGRTDRELKTRDLLAFEALRLAIEAKYGSHGGTGRATDQGRP